MKTTKTQPGHGGARIPGPGKEVRSHKRLTARRVNVLIEEDTIKFFIDLAGGGSRKLGRGIDKGAELLAKFTLENDRKSKPATKKGCTI